MRELARLLFEGILKNDETPAAVDLPPEERLLVALASGLAGGAVRDSLSLGAVSGRQWRKAVQLARWHRLLPLLHYRCSQDGVLSQIPGSALNCLRQGRHRAAASYLAQRANLGTVLESFSNKGIATIVLKGVPLAHRIYPDPALRVAHDIDLMVNPREFGRVTGELESLGFIQLGTSEVRAAFHQYHHHLAPFVHAQNGVMVEVHSRLFRPYGPYQLDVAGLWERSSPANTGKFPYLVLAPEDELLHLCLHFLNDRRSDKDGALLQVCDMGLFLSRYRHELNWESFIGRVRHHSLEGPVFASLYCASSIAGTLFPQEVTQIRPHDFSERLAGEFIATRVVGGSRRLPASVVEGLAQRGFLNKTQGLARAVSPAIRWVPAASKGSSGRGGVGAYKALLRPCRILVALWNLLLHLPQLRNQVRVERWLTEHIVSDTSSR